MMRKNKGLLVSLFVMFTFVLAACSPATAQPTTSANPTSSLGTSLDNTEWLLESFGPSGSEEPVIAGSTISLQFQGNGQAVGSGGCNTFSASYQVQDGKLSIRDVIHTEIACVDQNEMQQEQRFFEALQSAGNFENRGDQLLIAYDNGQGQLNFVKSSAVGSAETALLAASGAVDAVDATPAPQRITFAPGASSATVSGHLAVSGSAEYVIAAEAGQVMSVDLFFSQGAAILAIWGEDGNVLMSDHAEASSFNGVLPTTQDYFILLKGTPEGETDYQMVVTIPPLGENQPTQAPDHVFLPWVINQENSQGIQRISFAEGATSATVSGHLAVSGSKQYVIAASAGQTMTVDLSFTQGAAILAIWGEDGNVLMSDHAEASHFSQVLPTTQDYNILLKGTPEGETDYQMVVTIPPAP